ncbi:MAG TPA: C4-dicarboxylate transporter DcuC [Symbiobacteriaceae bacterium]|jgi:C4-dicarboxylate transporter, DcuC family|nr:C4-dicarboxylate transporter DcuC [Symbiobacteriaceae bacterium]
MTWTTIMPWVGGLIVIGTIYGIVKRWETRMVLIGAGLLMTLVAGKFPEAFKAFEKSMTNAGLIASILSVMGFAYVMKVTGADQHLVNLVAKGVTKVQFALIPASFAATYAVSIALPSASGATAAVGAVLIPVMMAAGIHPAVAAATIIAGTMGGNWSPGGSHPAMIAKMANMTIPQVVSILGMQSVFGGIVAATALSIQAFIMKENKGHALQKSASAVDFKVNYLMAVVPIIPLALVVLGTRPELKAWNLNIVTSMVIGSIIAIVFSRRSPAEITKAFFQGMGDAYGSTLGIIIGAGVFTAGLTQIGLIKALLGSITGASGAIGFVATVGPAAMAILTGSGDASAIAFNEAVTPHAETFGWAIQNLGTVAATAAALGRSMSPVAAAAIVGAGIAGVSPVEVAKRNAIPMILAIAAALAYTLFF